MRSVLDSGSLSMIVAPAMALPLGSVTVPCREVEEICENAGATVMKSAAIEQSAYILRDFMRDSSPQALGAPKKKRSLGLTG